jgi:hypothetical protein
VDTSGLDASGIYALESSGAAQYAGINNGIAQYESVTPGTYTAVAITGLQTDVPGTMRWTSTTVELAADQQASIQMAF